MIVFLTVSCTQSSREVAPVGGARLALSLPALTTVPVQPVWGTSYVVELVGIPALRLSPDQESAIRIELTRSLGVKASVGCNEISGGPSLSEDRLDLDFVTQLRPCDSEIAAIETHLLTFLSGRPSIVRLENGAIELRSASGTFLVLVPDR